MSTSLSSIVSTTSSIETLVQQYMSLEKKPLNTIQTKKAEYNTKIAVFNDFKTKLQNLYNLADDLSDTSGSSIFGAVQTTSSDTDIMTVTAGDDASQGQYTFRVKQLATSTSFKSMAGLNTNPSVRSSSSVVAGSDDLDADETWADAGFDTLPDGTVTINGETVTLSEYETVDDFMDAVNASDADANIYYDEEKDKFVIESIDGSDLVLSQTGTNGFLTEANIAEGTYSTNTTGLESDVALYKINFDTSVSSEDFGSFKINGVTFEWDADKDTLDSLISEINRSDAGVTAFYDDSLDRVMITSKTTGEEAIEWEDLTGDFLGGMLKLDGAAQSLGKNALFTVNSTESEDEISKSSNTFDLNGLMFTLKEATVANGDYSDPDTKTVTATVSKDETAVRTKISGLLNAYNSFIDYIRAKTEVNVTTYTRGALAGESVFRSLRSSVLGAFLGKVEGLTEGAPSYLVDLGITIGNDLHASLSDSEALSDMLTDNPQAVANLFNSGNGVASRLVELIKPYVESYGIIDDRKQSVEDQIAAADKRIERIEKRLELKAASYRLQFTTLQGMLNQITNQQSILSSLTSSLNSILGLG